MRRPPRPLTGGAVMGATSRSSVAVTGALTTILVARALGPEGAGAFSVALTVVYVLVVLTTLGVEHGIAYYVSAGRWPAADAFAASWRVAWLAGPVAAGAAVVARLALPHAFGGLTVAECALAAAALPFALTWYYGSFVALASDHYEVYVLAPALQSGALLVLALALVLPFGLSGAVAAVLASQVLAALATTWLVRRRLGARTGRRHLRRALTFGVKGYAANALQVLNYRVDLFVLSAVASAAALGHYAVAVAVTSVLWLLPQALGDVLFPRVAALSAAEATGQREFVEAKSLRHTTLLVAASTLALVPALLLIVPVYGPGFADSVTLGLIRLPGVALLGLAAPLTAITVGRGHPEYGLYTTLAVTPVTLALYALLIPALHAPGAALASSLSFALSFAATAAFHRRATGAPLLRRLLPTRSELADYRGLAPQMRAWAIGILARPRA
jgi:O-antigen/teichoic acid export membrane protein